MVGGVLSQVMEIVEGKLMTQLKINSRLCWCAVCPKPIRRIILETHRLTHSGVMRTVARIKLQWFWPGMMSEVRKTIQTVKFGR